LEKEWTAERVFEISTVILSKLKKKKRLAMPWKGSKEIMSLFSPVPGTWEVFGKCRLNFYH
jgi:hypothetical protein